MEGIISGSIFGFIFKVCFKLAFSNSLETEFCIEALEIALKHGPWVKSRNTTLSGQCLGELLILTILPLHEEVLT